MSTLKSAILIETGKKNKHLFDRKLHRHHLLHPVLFHVISLYNQDIDPGQWLEQQGENIDIPDIGTFSREEVGYYVTKFLILLANGYFQPIQQEKILSARFTADSVKDSMANCRNLIFETTDYCNLKCEYCGYGKFYGDYDQRETDYLNIDKAKNILIHMVDLWNSPLNRSRGNPVHLSFYGGEPLLNFTLIQEIVSYSRTLQLNDNFFRFNMTTNALLLEKYMDFLVENDFELLLSLDGDQSCNAYRVYKNGKCSFEDTIANIEALRKKYPTYFQERVSFNSVLHNKNSVARINKYIKEKFGKTPRIAELNQTGVKEEMAEDFRKAYVNTEESLKETEDYSLLQKEMLTALPTTREAMFFLRQNSCWIFQDYNSLIYPQEQLPRIPSGTCSPLSLRVFLTVRGKLLTCERIGQQLALGQVTTDEVQLDYNDIANRYNQWLDKVAVLCNQCYNAEGCSQCIFYLNLSNPEIQCNGLMDQQQYAQYVSGILKYLEDEPEGYMRILEEVSHG